MKRTNTNNQGDIMLRGAMGGMGMMDEYTEKPRPNLYNVIKKIKEFNGETLHRLCYLSKLDEKQFRGDFEKEFTNWCTVVCNTQEEDEIPLQEDEQLQYGGFAVVLGPYVVHMFEAEQTLMYRFIKKLLEKKNEPGSYYNNIWVLHYTEDIASKAYNGWNCKSISTQAATKEIKALPEFDKITTIYEGMCQIGT